MSLGPQKANRHALERGACNPKIGTKASDELVWEILSQSPVPQHFYRFPHEFSADSDKNRLAGR
jgi:ABC-type oligopeptide transport system ATPase subunit